jgi:cold shock CspA family protein
MPTGKVKFCNDDEGFGIAGGINAVAALVPK